ncbi:hypothetical protein DW175_06920 [Bacteroides sp. AM16-15]|nr:hypothetical protein DW175_06920 [Bacteroides sp. AM16-15]
MCTSFFFRMLSAECYGKCAKTKMVYHFVILNKVKELFTSTLCLQILRKVQNDSIISVLTHFYMQNDRSYDESRLSVL